MKVRTLMFALALGAAAAPAHAQTTAPATQPTAATTISGVVVNGTTELLANYVRATVGVSNGTPVNTIDAEAVKAAVMATGYFSSASIDFRPSPTGADLVIDVVPHANIGSVEATGLTFLSADAFRNSIAELLNIAPGAAMNTARLEEAKRALIGNYRSEGYPIEPSVQVETKPAADGTMNVRFVVDETAPLSSVRVQGVSLVPAQKITDIFRPLQQTGRFTPAAYYATVQQVQELYQNAGYLYSGVEVHKTTLENGVLNVQVLEGRVSGIDTSNLGEVPQETLDRLGTKVGGHISSDQISKDVRELANSTGKAVGFALQGSPNDPTAVTVYFGAADVVTAPIREVKIVGNTVLNRAELASKLSIKEGDVYSPQLAQENFIKMRDLYRSKGHEISTRDAVEFADGVLTYHIREVQLAGYELKWQGPKRTADRVILRELPKAGQPFNVNELRAALARINRLGFVRLVGEETRVSPEHPEQVTYVLTAAEADGSSPLNTLGLGLGYDSLKGGWGGDVSVSFPNVFGLGHTASLALSAQQNDAGQTWLGNASYTVPWLDLDFLDFREKRTSLSAGISSDVSGNQQIRSTHKFPNADPSKPEEVISQDTGREYTVRTNSFGINVGRNITPQIAASLGVGVSQKLYFLEAVKQRDVRSPYGFENGKQLWIDCHGKKVATSDEKDINLLRMPCTDASTLNLPSKSLTTSLTAGVSYDNVLNPAFPTSGVRADASASYNFGVVGSQKVNWSEFEAGARTYYPIGPVQPSKTAGQPAGHRQAVALRANGGTMLGIAPEGTGYRIGGGGSSAYSRQLRGIENGALFGKNFVTTSAEFRHDFDVNLGPARGVYGVLFADAGSAWDAGQKPVLKYGVGAGVQLDLGLGAFQLPPLRFDYGYSPADRSGRFYFRLGNFW